MARRHIGQEEVRALVNNGLVPLYMKFGSIVGVTAELNHRLIVLGEEGRLHANRLHPLFANDVSKGVNDETFNLIQLAIAVKNVPPVKKRYKVDAVTPPAVQAYLSTAPLRSILTPEVMNDLREKASNSREVGVPSRIVDALLTAAEPVVS